MNSPVFWGQVTGNQKDMGYVTYNSPEEWVEKSKVGFALPLAKEAGTWSEAKVFNMPSGPISIQSKFVNQQGTTCTFEVKFLNYGTNIFNQRIALQSNQRDQVFYNRLTNVTVKPNTNVWYEMEKRECALKWGTSTDMKTCAECNPQVIYLQ